MSRDLVILVPDKDIEHALKGLLARPEALGIRKVTHELLVHPNRDPGCYHTSAELLATYSGACTHALVVFDRAWEGAPSPDASVLATHVEGKLKAQWAQRGRCVVIDPEIEAWVWSDSPHVSTVLGWEGRNPTLRTWLEQQGLWPANTLKPADPKTAFERAVRETKVVPSAALFGKLADKVSFRRCTDPGFVRLCEVLRAWFGPQAGSPPGTASP